VKTKLIICLIAASLTGCAAMNQSPATIYPTIDMAMNPKERDYHADINQCNAYIRNTSIANSAMNSAVVGGAFGAVLGAVIGAAVGVNPGQMAAVGAGAMGVSAGAEGAVGAAKSRRAIVAKCMSGRGYTVLRP
jgi:outer membrane lipoprotein SlyB